MIRDVLHEGFSVATHAGFTLVFLIVGAICWLANGYLADRSDAVEVFDSTYEDLPSFRDSEKLRDGRARLARRTGKILVTLGTVGLISLGIRLGF